MEVKVQDVTFEWKEVNEYDGVIYGCEMTPNPGDVTASMKWLFNGVEVGSDTTLVSILLTLYFTSGFAASARPNSRFATVAVHI